MDRRNFLKSTGGAAAALATAGAAATAPANAAPSSLPAPPLLKGVIEVGLASPWPETFAGYSDSARRIARRIEQASSSKLRVNLIAGAASNPAAELVLGTENDRARLHPAFAFFAGLPGEMGLAPVDLDGWLAVGGGQLLWDDLAADAGFKPLLAGHTGATPVLWSKTEINAVSDVAGRRLFARGLAADVARALGAECPSLSEIEAIGEIKTGGIDAIEWGSLLQSSADSIPQHLPFGTPAGLSAGGTAISLNISLALWDKLEPGLQMGIATAAAEEFRACVAEARVHEALVVNALNIRFGVRLTPAPASFRDAVNRVAGAVVAHAAAADKRAQRINASYMQYRKAVDSASGAGLIRMS